MSQDENFKLLESYQAFSAEVVRVSLLAIAGIGALYTMKPADSPLGLEQSCVKLFFLISLFAYGLAVTAAMAHRYWATDFMACQVKLDRLRDSPPSYKTQEQIAQEIADETAARRQASLWSYRTIWGGPLFLAVGSLFLTLAFAAVLLSFRVAK